ncbi:tRNA synthetase [Methanosarcina sp. WWM596]|uniref:tRNA synthetase n=1 Tax=Methanosarcina sp. WWM596 TaxID=1434103 RepID=UPI0006157BEE|nr:tRNA synthetase [Methanosarcina sp. WWM596]AKB17846.1 OB-fold nucleic acid binding domain protein [Methanosarcina sp. WWM596]
MEKEEKVVVVLLVMALSSLSTAYLFFGQELAGAGQQSEGKALQYTHESEVGEKVSLDAEVLSKRFTYTGDHLLLEVNFNSEVLSIFIPKTAGADALNESINEGDFINITGTVSEYEGKREIKVERKEDIVLK